MKKLRWRALALLLALILALPLSAAAEEGGAQTPEDLSDRFADQALLAAVRGALALEEGEALTREALDGLTALDLSQTPVSSHQGLELAGNLAYNKVALPALDPAVDAAVRNSLRVTDSARALTWYDLRRLKSLDLTGEAVASLDGLQWADNLTALFVDTCAPAAEAGVTRPALGDEALTVLAQLPLQQLQLDNAALTRLPAVKNGGNLTRLDVRNNRITSLSGVESMVNLTRLEVSGNEALTDFTALNPAIHASLGTLRLSGTRPDAASLTAIGKLGVDTLFVDDCAITDFSFLTSAALKGALSYLDVSGNTDSNLESVLGGGEFSFHGSLILNRTGITDFTCLDRCAGNTGGSVSSFSALGLAGNGITSLEGLPRAGRLDLSENRICDLSPLRDHGTIGDLNLSDNRIASLAGLPGRVTSLRARNNRIANLSGLQGTAVTYLYLENNRIRDLSVLSAVMAEKGIVKLDGNYIDPSAAADVLDALKAKGVSCSVKDQKEDAGSLPAPLPPESPLAPPAAIGEAEVTTALLLSAKSATRGSLVTVRAVCENTGSAPLGAHTFSVLCSPQSGVSVTGEGVMSMDSAGLAPGESEELLFTLKVSGAYNSNDPIRLITHVQAGDEALSTDTAALNVYYATLTAPETAYAGKALQVCGEATVGSHVAILDQDRRVLAEVDMAANNRWYTATVPAQYVTESLTGLSVRVTGVGPARESELVPIQVNTSDVYFNASTILGPNGREYTANSYVGFPTLIATLDAQMNGPRLTPRLWLGNAGAVKSVTFTFAGKTVPGAAVTLRGETVYTVGDDTENFSTWSATGVQRMTATVTQADGAVRTFLVAQFTVLIDPSGTVRDPDGQPISGVKVTLQEKVGDTWQDWDAEPYLQTNPVYTDDAGWYGWDVPEGTYRVVMEKPGYYPKAVETYVPKSNPGGPAIPLVVAPAHTEVDAVLDPWPLSDGVWAASRVSCKLTLPGEGESPVVLCAFYDGDGAMISCRMFSGAQVSNGRVTVDKPQNAASAKFFLLDDSGKAPVSAALPVGPEV